MFSGRSGMAPPNVMTSGRLDVLVGLADVAVLSFDSVTIEVGSHWEVSVSDPMGSIV